MQYHCVPGRLAAPDEYPARCRIDRPEHRTTDPAGAANPRRMFADSRRPRRRAIPQNGVIFWNVAEVSQESACRLASVQFPFAGATGHEPGEHPMKKLLFAGAMLASFAAIQSASAADLALKALPPPAPVYSWNGWYVGLNLGGSFGKAADTATFGAGPTLLLDVVPSRRRDWRWSDRLQLAGQRQLAVGARG